MRVMHILNSVLSSRSLHSRRGRRIETGSVFIERLEQRLVLDAAAFNLIGLAQLRADPQFQDINGKGEAVAVIDTGVDRTQPLISGNFLAGFDFQTNADDNGITDPHGTHVAGIIGSTDPTIGEATGAGIIGLQAFGDVPGQTGVRAIYLDQALQWVLDHYRQYHIVAVNMSLGGGHFTDPSQVQSDPTFALVKQIEQDGVIVVTANGNSYFEQQTQNLAQPAIYSTLAVGAVWKDGSTPNARWGSGASDLSTGADRVTSFSQRDAVSNVIFAPGAIITSARAGGGLLDEAGTSQATPMVSGAVAIVQQAAEKFGGRLLSPAEVRNVLISNADTIHDGDDENTNVTPSNRDYPRLNVYKAVQAVKQMFAQNGGGGGGGSAPADPNGTLAGAVPVGSLDGTRTPQYEGTIGTDGGNVSVGPKDVDLFQFTLTYRTSVTIQTATDPARPADFQTLLRVFDQNGNALGAVPGNGGYVTLLATLDPGTYYVGVSGAGNENYDPRTPLSGTAGQTGNYLVTLLADAQQGLFDPNGTLAGAVNVVLDPNNHDYSTTLKGFIGADLGKTVGPGDVDIFKVVVPDNGRLLIAVDTPYASGYVDSYLRVFDVNGNELAHDDDSDNGRAPGHFYIGNEIVDDANGNFIGHRTDSFVQGVNLLRGATYYFAVSDFRNANYSPTDLTMRNTSGSGGLYNITITFQNNDLNGSISQAVASSLVPLPSTGIHGVIGSDGIPTGGVQQVGDKDVDFIRIHTTTAGLVEASVNALSIPNDPFINGNPAATVLTLWDAQGHRLAASDNSAQGHDPLLRFLVNADTDYYVSISGAGNDAFDPFRLGSGNSGQTGNYIYNQQLLPVGQAVVLSDNTTGSQSIRSISVGDTLNGDIGSDDGIAIGPNDVDLYRFQPTANQTVRIRASAVGDFGADTFLRVFDGNGSELPGAANNDTVGHTADAQLTLVVQASQTYFIGVNGASSQARQYTVTGTGAAPGRTGPYQLSVTSLDDGNTPLVRMYRVYNQNADVHHFTTNNVEFNALVNNLGITDETDEIPGFAVIKSGTSGVLPLHRMYNQHNGQHYLTASNSERDALLAIDPTGHGWVYEGDDGAVYSSSQQGSTELFMLYNDINGEHLYTPSSAERDAVAAIPGNHWHIQTSLGFGYAIGTDGHIPTPNTSPTQQPSRRAPARLDTDEQSSPTALFAGNPLTTSHDAPLDHPSTRGATVSPWIAFVGASNSVGDRDSAPTASFANTALRRDPTVAILANNVRAGTAIQTELSEPDFRLAPAIDSVFAHWNELAVLVP